MLFQRTGSRFRLRPATESDQFVNGSGNVGQASALQRITEFNDRMVRRKWRKRIVFCFRHIESPLLPSAGRNDAVKLPDIGIDLEFDGGHSAIFGNLLFESVENLQDVLLIGGIRDGD